jgi:Gas vesicle synthesis protein GvpL/GvpF
VIELLAITDDPGAPPPPLRLVPAGPVGVVVGPAPEGEVDAEALWERESLLEDLMGKRALLPIRYGTRVEDDAAAAAAVEPRGAELAAALDRVRGAVEVSVRAVAREGAEAGDVSAIHARLSGLARDHARLEGSEPLRAAYLVDRAAVDGFVAAVRELQHEHGGLSILCTGPWPPYSFTEPR